MVRSITRERACTTNRNGQRRERPLLIAKLVELLFAVLRPWRRGVNQRRWHKRWSRCDVNFPWSNRGTSKEIKVAVRNGWIEPGCVVVDLGCGEGEVAHWLAGQGFVAVGVDIAPAAIGRAKSRHTEVPGRLEFRIHDLCAEPLPLQGVKCFIDRGCFHQVPSADVDAYVRNVVNIAAPGARCLVFVKAFRNDTGLSKADEQAKIVETVKLAFAPHFGNCRVTETNLGGIAPDGTRNHLPGLVFWLTCHKKWPARGPHFAGQRNG